MPQETGIEGRKIKEILQAILNAMEDDAIYDDPVFSLLYAVLLRFTTNSST
jgi:hypothetical protein